MFTRFGRLTPLYSYSKELSFLIAGICIAAFSIFFISKFSLLLSSVMNVAGFLIAGIPTIYLLYHRHAVTKGMEEQFVELMRDLTDSVESGMTLPLALESSSKRDYGHLSKGVNELASQVNWGIPFEKALKTFAAKIGSKTISRAVHTVIETYKAGGKVSATLNAVANSLQSIEKINKERVSAARSQLATIYFIFAVFIVIMVILQLFLLPQIQLTGTGFSTDFLTATFANFILLQGFFSGLVAGKLSENSYSTGLKHALIYMAVGYGVFTITIQSAPLLG